MDQFSPAEEEYQGGRQNQGILATVTSLSQRQRMLPLISCHGSFTQCPSPHYSSHVPNFSLYLMSHGDTCGIVRLCPSTAPLKSNREAGEMVQQIKYLCTSVTHRVQILSTRYKKGKGYTFCNPVNNNNSNTVGNQRRHTTLTLVSTCLNTSTHTHTQICTHIDKYTHHTYTLPPKNLSGSKFLFSIKNDVVEAF